jgi:hypothetical protein
VGLAGLGYRGEKALPALVGLAPALGLIAVVLREALVEVGLLHCPLQVQSGGAEGQTPECLPRPTLTPPPCWPRRVEYIAY